jgi:hypothetical protein
MVGGGDFLRGDESYEAGNMEFVLCVCIFLFYDVFAAEVMFHRISGQIGALQCRVSSPLVA